MKKIEEFLKTCRPANAIIYNARRKRFMIIEVDDAYDPGYWGETISEAIENALNDKKHEEYCK